LPVFTHSGFFPTYEKKTATLPGITSISIGKSGAEKRSNFRERTRWISSTIKRHVKTAIVGEMATNNMKCSDKW